jgi:hypothetical protein
MGWVRWKKGPLFGVFFLATAIDSQSLQRYCCVAILLQRGNLMTPPYDRLTIILRPLFRGLFLPGESAPYFAIEPNTKNPGKKKGPQWTPFSFA